MEEIISEVEVALIKVSPFQPRRYFLESEIDELAQSIQSIGLIQPPVVRKIVQKDRLLYYELIAGERRWRASIKAGLKKIPVIVRDSTDAEAAEASLIENIQRVDLNPLEMAEAFSKLIDIFRLTQEEIAQQVGKKRSTIANYLRLLTLPVHIRESIQTGAITMGHAKAILSIEDVDLKEALHQLILKEGLTVRESEEKSVKLAQKPRKITEKNIHVRDLEERLERHFKTKVIVQPQGKEGKGGGKVTIHYSSLDDLDYFLAQISLAQE